MEVKWGRRYIIAHKKGESKPALSRLILLQNQKQLKRIRLAQSIDVLVAEKRIQSRTETFKFLIARFLKEIMAMYLFVEPALTSIINSLLGITLAMQIMR